MAVNNGDNIDHYDPPRIATTNISIIPYDGAIIIMIMIMIMIMTMMIMLAMMAAADNDND